MSYEQTIAYLYQKLPVFHRIGKKAFKADLTNTVALCEHLGNPHQKFKTIHIAGTNGKGSTSHYIAAILQSAGYKTGLYTSPHLKSFTERIRINGESIPQARVVEFVSNNKVFIESLEPSFFELSVGMAFEYFAKEEVDIAVIEVGLGGRLDSTNIIIPELSVITNIDFDHTDILGDTLSKIAFEKAGIIKSNVPVVISEWNQETADVFMEKANAKDAPIRFATDYYTIEHIVQNAEDLQIDIRRTGDDSSFQISSQLMGIYQAKNIIGVLSAFDVLIEKGYKINSDNISQGFSQVINLTGLKGRWQTLSNSPRVLCDTAHNVAGISQILENLKLLSYNKLWMILGFVSDKDISSILNLLPQNANYIFCEANIPRALETKVLMEQAAKFNLVGEVMINVNAAIEYVKTKCNTDDFVYVGGSTFVVAEINDL